MKILVLNGSPKGQYSVTVQTAKYLEKKYPEHIFEFLDVGKKIKALEKDFSPVVKYLEKADMLLFSYPVYTFIAPSQLHRFIELLKASGIDLTGKYATQITTSKHFYDVTAHKYIEENCKDMGMRYVRGLSADMDDLLTEKGQKEACAFLEYAVWCAENQAYEPLPALAGEVFHSPVEIPECTEEKSGDVVIVTDCGENDAQLAAMIARFRAVFPLKTRVVNLCDYPFKGGCLGCFNCAVSGKRSTKTALTNFFAKIFRRRRPRFTPLL